MAQRPIWRGHLRLALVSCPVALYSARHERGTVRFNMINPATGNRIRSVTQDAETGDEVARRDTVKGYEFEKDRYLIVTDEDFESVRVESSSVMSVEKFVDAGSIDPIYYDSSYYVAPDGRNADDVYAVLREAVRRTGKVALTRIVMSQRERTIALRPMADGIVAHTLHEAGDLNDAKPLFEPVGKASIDPEMVGLAVQLIDRQSGRYDPADIEDRYEARLRAMIEAKLQGQGLKSEEAAPSAPSNVVDIMSALRRSLGEEAAPAAGKKPGRAATAAGKSAAKAGRAEEMRRQPGLKLPIEGGRSKAEPAIQPSAQIEPASLRPGRRKA